MDNNFITKFHSPDDKYELLIEDNARVAYAYLIQNNNIISDVWLYNRSQPELKPEWNDPKLMPFANAEEYILEDEFNLPNSENDFSVEWTDSDPMKPKIYIKGLLHAVLSTSEKIGQCRLAKKDGPLAKVLRIHE